MINLLEGLNLYYLVVIFLLGLCIGSFLNVVIYRVPKELSIAKGRSACTACGKTLGAWDLIPLFSYLGLKGKCRYCKEKVSPRYILVESITGLTFVGIFLRYGLSAEFFAFSFIMSILIAVFFIDLEHMIIPDGLVIAGLVGGAGLILYHGVVGFEYYGFGVSWWWPLLGMLISPVILIGIALVGSLFFGGAEVMGGGDIKIYAPIGIFLGVEMVLVSLFFSFIVGGFVGGVLLIAKKKEKGAHIPFGPFIVIATLITILFGKEMLMLYLR
jgi:leader peptidase (prepilin peptidase) / N-methyltransferase